MQKNRTGSAGVLLIAGAVMSFLSGAIIGCSNEGELGEARAWATLQGVDSTYTEDASLRTPFVIRDAIGSGYDVAGFESGTTDSYVWVLLDDGTEKVKTSIQGVHPLVSCKDVNDLVRKEKVSRAVANYLREICGAPSVPVRGDGHSA